MPETIRCMQFINDDHESVTHNHGQRWGCEKVRVEGKSEEKVRVRESGKKVSEEGEVKCERVVKKRRERVGEAASERKRERMKSPECGEKRKGEK